SSGALTFCGGGSSSRSLGRGALPFSSAWATSPTDTWLLTASATPTARATRTPSAAGNHRVRGRVGSVGRAIWDSVPIECGRSPSYPSPQAGGTWFWTPKVLRCFECHEKSQPTARLPREGFALGWVSNRDRPEFVNQSLVNSDPAEWASLSLGNPS